MVCTSKKTSLGTIADDISPALQANGTAPASMVTDALARYENLYGEEGTVEEIVKSNAATAFVGAADTVSALLKT